MTKENTSFGIPRIWFVCPVFKMAAITVYWPIRPFHGLIRHLGYGANHVIDQDGDSLIVNKEVNE